MYFVCTDSVYLHTKINKHKALLNNEDIEIGGSDLSGCLLVDALHVSDIVLLHSINH